MIDPMRPTAWKLCTLSEWYSTRFCRNPPTKEPTMPSRMVPKTPMESRPGMSRRAMAPTTNPTISRTMMKTTMSLEFPPCGFYAKTPGLLLAGQLAFQRGAEARGDPGRPDPLAEPLRPGRKRRRGLRAGVLEQPHDDLAVLAL